MFSVQIGSLLACRDDCALEFALKVDRDAGGTYLGGTGGAILGSRHIFVAATEPTTIVLAALERAKTKPLTAEGTVLSTSGKGASSSSSSSLKNNNTATDTSTTPAATTQNPPNWLPALSRCDWNRRNNMKADLEEALGIDGVSYASYDQIRFAGGIDKNASGAEGSDLKRKAATNAKRQRNSVKMIKSRAKRQREIDGGSKKKSNKGAAAQKKRRKRQDDDSFSDESEDDFIDDDDDDLSDGFDDSDNEEGLRFGETCDDDQGSESGSVVEFSDGMDEDDD